jgi:hypothetical protein
MSVDPKDMRLMFHVLMFYKYSSYMKSTFSHFGLSKDRYIVGEA